jgi:hypothetical protein
VKRYVYAFDSPAAARSAIALLRTRGISDKQISVIARSDIQLDEVPNRYLDASTDFAPALGRGAAIGGITGLFAGIVAMAIPPLGIAIGGPALFGFLAGGAAVGAWSSAMVGSSVPDEVRRTFDDEIKAGRSLLVVDSDNNNDASIMTTLSPENPHVLWQGSIDKTPAV